MPRCELRGLPAAALSVLLALPAGAHETASPDAAAAAAEGPARELTITLSPDAPAPVVDLRRGERVHLSVDGAAGQELHLHGYDIEVMAPASGLAVFDFEARHSGRFPVVVHDEADLLGQRERAILYLEVRER